MEFRNLANTDHSISSIGMGTWQLAGMMGTVDRKQATGLIRKAIDRGITFVDCAESYGDSEKLVGEALSDGYRDKCFLATKVSTDFSAAGVEKAFKKSLNGLKTDWIDLYQIHSYDPETPVEETLRRMASFQEKGYIRYCGVSNFTVEQLRQARHVLPVVSNQINYNALNRSPEKQMLRYCNREKISVISHSSLAKGLLCGKYEPDHVFASNDERSGFPGYSGKLFADYLAMVEELQKVAAEYNLNIIQAVINWLLAREELTSVLVGPKSIAQLEESTRAAGALTVRSRAVLREQMDKVLDTHDLPPLCPFPNQLV